MMLIHFNSCLWNSGSLIPQCSPEDGQCPCKPGVTGQYCEACEPTHFNFGPAGCEDCQCRPDGSLNNTPKCDPVTANCECKQNVEGKITANIERIHKEQ